MDGSRRFLARFAEGGCGIGFAVLGARSRESICPAAG
jgi:hypothetical protein